MLIFEKIVLFYSFVIHRYHKNGVRHDGSRGALGPPRGCLVDDAEQEIVYMTKVPAGFLPANFSPGFLALSGPYFIHRAEAETRLGLLVGAAHANYVGVAHGGVLATFADVALSFAVHDSETPALTVVSNTLTVNFLAGAKSGDWLEATCRLDRKGKRMAYCSGEIRRSDEVLMTMTGVYTILTRG